MNRADLDWLTDLIPDATLLVGRDQVILAANHRAEVLFGATPGALRHLTLETLIPETSRLAHRDLVENFFRSDRCRAMGSGARFQGRRFDGQRLPVDIMLNRTLVAGQDMVVAVIRDNSERMAVQQVRDELRASNARLARAQEVGGLGWWECDVTSGCVVWSPMIPGMLGLPEDLEPSLTLVAELCHADDRKQLLALHQNLSTSVGQRLSYRIRKPDGEIRWIQEAIDQGPDNLILGVMRDITREKRLEEKLRQESVIDDLTGLYNRKQFRIDLRGCYSEYVRRGKNAAVVMYDFDYFKNINDCHGHIMGDQVLRQSAQVVADQLRPSDRAYRLGGEEFAIILGGASADDAQTLAERIRRSIEAFRFRSKDSLIHATISLGISRFRTSDTNLEDILRRADEALYRSKSRSRNRTSLLE